MILAPPTWVSYDRDASVINVEWPYNATAEEYRLYYTDAAGVTNYISYSQPAGAVDGDSVPGTAPCALTDGTPLDLQVRHTDASNDEVSISPSVTMICANVPLSPATPTLLLRSLDLLLLEWEPPTDDGGSPILGYSVHMR